MVIEYTYYYNTSLNNLNNSEQTGFIFQQSSHNCNYHDFV